MAWERWAALLLIAGCTFDSHTMGSSGQVGETESEGTSTGDTGTVTAMPTTDSSMSGSPSTSTTEPTSTSNPTSTTDPTTSTSEPTTTSTASGEPSTAVLELSEAFDFGAVDVGTSASHMFTLTNTGEVTATAITPLAMPSEYAVESTDCAASLEPEASCTITVQFSPTALGPIEGTLDVAYDDGAAANGVDAGLDGGGAGETDSLVVNGGAEQCTDSFPSGWTEAFGDQWVCGSNIFGELPHSGIAMFFPGMAMIDTVPELEQRIEIPGDLEDAVASGELGVRFVGWSRSIANNDDPRRFRVEFVDAGDTVVDEWDSGWDGNTGWEEATDERTIDASTVEIRVHLECDMSAGGYCSALYDDVELMLFYPPP